MIFYISMVILASLISVAISQKTRLRYGFSAKQAVIMAIVGFISGLLGAKLLFKLEYIGMPFRSGLGGMSFFGTVIIIPVCYLITAKLMKLPYGKVLDFGGIYIPLVLAFARIGCFYTGCCGASELTLHSGEVVTPPIQLIESAFDFITFFALLYWDKAGMVRFEGEQYPKFVLLYSFIRLVMENYRDTDKFLAGMSEGQWFSIICFIAALIALSKITKAGLKKQAAEAKSPAGEKKSKSKK